MVMKYIFVFFIYLHIIIINKIKHYKKNLKLIKLF